MINPGEPLNPIIINHPDRPKTISITLMRDPQNREQNCVGCHIGIDGSSATLRQWAVRFDRLAEELTKAADQADAATTLEG